MLEKVPSRSDSDSEFTIVIARTLIRIVKAERLGYDDYWIYLAYLILCINAALQTIQTPYIYHMVRVRAGLEPAGDGFLKDGNNYLRYEFAIIGLFWSVLWSVSARKRAKYSNRTFYSTPQDTSREREATSSRQFRLMT